MFDSNASGLNVNVYFFAEVHSVSCDLKQAGFVTDSIIVCKHIEKEEESFGEEKRIRSVKTKTLVWLTPDADPIEIVDGIFIDDKFRTSLIYSGDLDGYGFIDNKWKGKALKFLGGYWRMTNNL